MEKLTIFGKIRQVITKRLPLWAVLLLLVTFVGGWFLYQHAKLDHESLHTMVQFFNNCLAKPECKQLFMAPAAPGK